MKTAPRVYALQVPPAKRVRHADEVGSRAIAPVRWQGKNRTQGALESLETTREVGRPQFRNRILTVFVYRVEVMDVAG